MPIPIPDPFGQSFPTVHRQKPAVCGAEHGDARCSLYRDHEGRHRDMRSFRSMAWPQEEVD